MYGEKAWGKDRVVEPEDLDLEKMLRQWAQAEKRPTVGTRHFSKQEIWLFSSGELPAAERERIQAHVEQCPSCLEELGWADIDILVHKAPEELTDEQRASRREIVERALHPDSEDGEQGSSPTSSQKGKGFGVLVPTVVSLTALAAAVLLVMPLLGPSLEPLKVVVEPADGIYRGQGDPQGELGELLFDIRIECSQEQRSYFLLSYEGTRGTRTLSLIPSAQQPPDAPATLLTAGQTLVLPATGQSRRPYKFKAFQPGLLLWGGRVANDPLSEKDWITLKTSVQETLSENGFNDEAYSLVVQLAEQYLESVSTALVPLKEKEL